MNSKIDLYLINGPLGAGKTTVIRKLIKDAKFKKSRIIENEFANISIDTDRFHDHESEIKTIAGLCVCCSTGNELIDTLKSLADSNDPVILEATGVANSLAIIEKIAPSEVFAKYNVAQSIFVIEAPIFDINSVKIYIEEMLAADIVLLTKSDLVPKSKLDKIFTLAKKNNIANFQVANNGDFDHSMMRSKSHIVEFYANINGDLRKHDSDTNYTVIDLHSNLNQSAIKQAWPKIANDFGLRRMKGDFLDDEKSIHVEATPSQINFTKPSNVEHDRLVLIGAKARNITEKILMSYMEE